MLKDINSEMFEDLKLHYEWSSFFLKYEPLQIFVFRKPGQVQDPQMTAGKYIFFFAKFVIHQSLQYEIKTVVFIRPEIRRIGQMNDWMFLPVIKRNLI